MAAAVLRLILGHTGECLMSPPGKAGVGAAGVKHRAQEGEAGRTGARQTRRGRCEGGRRGARRRWKVTAIIFGEGCEGGGGAKNGVSACLCVCLDARRNLMRNTSKL